MQVALFIQANLDKALFHLGTLITNAAIIILFKHKARPVLTTSTYRLRKCKINKDAFKMMNDSVLSYSALTWPTYYFDLMTLLV